MSGDLERLVGDAESELNQSLAKASPDAAPGSSLGRTMARTTGGVLGGATGFMLGGMAGGIGSIPGAITGAGLGTGGADVLYDLATGTRRSLPQQAMQTGGAMLEGASSEVMGRGIAKAGAPVARALGLSRDLSPAQQESKAAFDKFGIPYLPSDVTGSRAMARVENIPSFFAIGVGPMQKHATRAVTAAESALGKQVSALGPAADDIAAGIAAQGNVKEAVKQFRADKAMLFDRINQMVGDAPVVGTENMARMSEGLLGQAEKGILPAAKGASKIQDIALQASGTTGAGVGTLPGGSQMPVSGLPPHIQQLLGIAQSGGKITFQQARQLETELGMLGYQNAAPLPGIDRGRIQGLYRAVRDDIDAFLKPSMGPANVPVNAALEEAKQVARTGNALFNDSMRSLVLGKSVRPEAVVNRVFRPGALTDTLDFKLAVSDDVWQKAQAAWLGGIFDASRTMKSTVTGGADMLSPAKFVSKLRPYIGTGQLEAILGNDKARELVDLWKVMGRMGRSETLAGNPSGTAGAVLSTGQFGALLGAGWKLSSGDIPGAAMATTGALAPLALAKGITSERGKQLALEGLSGKYTKPALRFASHFIGASTDQP